MDDEHTEFLEELKMEMLEEQRREEEEMERAVREEEEQVGCGIFQNIKQVWWWWWLDMFVMDLLFYIYGIWLNTKAAKVITKKKIPYLDYKQAGCV